MNINDVPKNQWFRLGHIPAPYNYERYMFVTNIKIGDKRFCLDCSKNTHLTLKGDNSFLRDGFWHDQNKDEVYIMDPPEKERIQRESIISIW